MNAIRKTKPVSIRIPCSHCDGDRRVICGNCGGGGTSEHPCYRCGNRGDEPCEACETGWHELPDRLHALAKQVNATFGLAGGQVLVHYVRAGESIDARFDWVEVEYGTLIDRIELFLEKLKTPRAIPRDKPDIASTVAEWLERKPTKQDRVVLIQNIAADLGLSIAVLYAN